MFCIHCGAEIADGLTQCPFCKKMLISQETLPLQSQQQPQLQQQSQSQLASQLKPVKKQYPYPMKWYFFLVRVQWILAVLMAFSYGCSYLNGFIYTIDYSVDSPKMVYALLPMMRTTDIIYGIFIIGYGVYTIYVWRQLKAFKKNAPLLHIAGFAVAGAASFIWLLIFQNQMMSAGYKFSYNAFVIISSFSSSALASICNIFCIYTGMRNANVVICLIDMAIYCLLNRIYFRKRSSLFVN